MEKKDPDNKDISQEKEQEAKTPVSDKNTEDSIAPEAKTEIKNAHASGLGAIGRSEEEE